jgi:transposase
MRSLISTAHDELRSELRDLSIYKVLELASAYRRTGRTDVTGVTKLTLRTLARRALSLEDEVKEIDRLLKILVAETAPELVAIDGVGTDVASALLVAAGDNPERLKNEATFAKLCGVAPSTPRAARTNVTASTMEETARPTRLCGTSCSPGWSTTREPSTTSSIG